MYGLGREVLGILDAVDSEGEVSGGWVDGIVYR